MQSFNNVSNEKLINDNPLTLTASSKLYCWHFIVTFMSFFISLGFFITLCTGEGWAFFVLFFSGLIFIYSIYSLSRSNKSVDFYIDVGNNSLHYSSTPSPFSFCFTRCPYTQPTRNIYKFDILSAISIRKVICSNKAKISLIASNGEIIPIFIHFNYDQAVRFASQFNIIIRGKPLVVPPPVSILNNPTSTPPPTCYHSGAGGCIGVGEGVSTSADSNPNVNNIYLPNSNPNPNPNPYVYKNGNEYSSEKVQILPPQHQQQHYQQQHYQQHEKEDNNVGFVLNQQQPLNCDDTKY